MAALSVCSGVHLGKVASLGVPKKSAATAGFVCLALMGAMLWFHSLPVPTLPSTTLGPGQRLVLQAYYGDSIASSGLMATLTHAAWAQARITLFGLRRPLNHELTFSLAGAPQKDGKRPNYLRRSLIAYKIRRAYPAEAILAGRIAKDIGGAPTAPECLAAKLAFPWHNSRRYVDDGDESIQEFERQRRNAADQILVSMYSRSDGGFSISAARRCLKENWAKWDVARRRKKAIR